MEPQNFEILLKKLNDISVALDKLAKNKPSQLTAKDITSAMVEALDQDKDTDKLTGRERRKLQKIAKIFKKEFEDVDMSKRMVKEDKVDMFKYTLVRLDQKSFKGLEKTLKTVLPDLFDNLKKDKKEEKQKGGLFGLLGDIVGGAFGAFGALNKVIPFLLAAGGLALAFYMIKNIEKIAKSIDMVLRSGKENLPTILQSLSKDLFPFWDDFTDTAIAFFDRILDSIDTTIQQLPILLDIVLKNIPMIRQEFRNFNDDMYEYAEKLKNNTWIDNIRLLALYLGGAYLLKSVTGIVGQFKVLNTLATTALVLSISELFKSFASLQDISWDTVAKGGIIMGATLGSMFLIDKLGASGAIQFLKGALGAGGVAFGIIKYLETLGPVLKEWGTIDWEALGKAGVAIGGIFATLEAAAFVGTAGVLPALITLGVALLAAGSAMVAIRGIGESLKPVMGTYERLKDLFVAYSEINWFNLSKVATAVTAMTAALTFNAVGGGVSAVISTATDFWDKLTGQKSPLEKLKEFELLDGDKLDKNAQAIKSLFEALKIGGSEDIKKAINNLNTLKPQTGGYDNAGAMSPSNAARGTVAGDFISRPNQPPLLFSSQDTLVAFKRTGLFDSVEQKIDSNYNRINETLNKLIERQQAMTEAGITENRKHTGLLEKIASSNATMVDQPAGMNMFNSSVNNNIVGVDTYTSTSYRSKLGRSPGVPA